MYCDVERGSVFLYGRLWVGVDINGSNVWSIKTGFHDIVLEEQQYMRGPSLSYSSGLTHHALSLQAGEFGIQIVVNVVQRTQEQLHILCL